MQKVRDHCHYTGKYCGAAHSICNLRYKISKEVPVVFHNGPTYDYHFIIKQLAREFNGYFHCLGENTEKYITFSIPDEKVLNNDNDNDSNSDSGSDNGNGKAKKKIKKITYRLKFIDSCRFMQDSLSTLVDNLSEIDKEPDNKSYDALIGKFPNTYQLSDKDLDKFELFLRKGVYPYENMDSWKRFKEESLPDKESFDSALNIEHITDEDCAYAQKVWSIFNIKNLGEYHDLYVQSDTALLADVAENFRDACLEIYGLDPAYFLSTPGLAWHACLKKTEVELELLTDNDMLLTFEKGTRGGMCQATYRYVKPNNKYMKNFDKNKESDF